MKNLILLFSSVMVLFLVVACGGKDDNKKAPKAPVKKEQPKNDKGVGEFKNVELTNPLDQTMIATGEGVYNLKCAACHKLSDKRLVGPGFKGVTDRRKPEWIMNMITNVSVMLDEDPEAQKLLAECLTRMPNQNVKGEDARAILEFLRKNDGVE